MCLFRILNSRGVLKNREYSTNSDLGAAAHLLLTTPSNDTATIVTTTTMYAIRSRMKSSLSTTKDEQRRLQITNRELTFCSTSLHSLA